MKGNRPITKNLTDLFVNSKLITEKQLDKAREVHKAKGGNLGKILVEQGMISQKDLMMVLSEGLNIPPISLSRYKVDEKVMELIPEYMARQYLLLPISKIGKILTVAMADPLNIFAIDDIKVLTKYEVKPIIAAENEIQETLDLYYSKKGKGLKEVLKDMEKEGAAKDEISLVGEDELDISEIEEESKKPPIVKMVDLVILEALKRRASDIHVEPCEKDLRIRYRIDGNLEEVLRIPRKSQNAILARLKIMSRLNITESRIPQDGRFRVRAGEREIDFRVSVLPTSHGGKIVMRTLDKADLSVGLANLGFLPEPLKVFEEGIKSPYGMILVTGPTGSGKSTTLYSIINQLNTKERNIMTIEDPVEYQLGGITQMQVLPDIGLTFADGLKAVLRQSPDVIMIGEIRDFETADIAIKAALTGQLIFSTLHTNDAAGALTRLVDMGIEPFLIASSLVLSVAQRLCRRLCSGCKKPYDIPKSVLDRNGISPVGPDGKKRIFYTGEGCTKCNNTGYFGRMGTLEILRIDDAVKEMIVSRAMTKEIKEYAVKKQGMKTLRDNAISKLIMGSTTLEEVLRITAEE
ncbi:MAG: Flp pilus assembly complex ATPase component TadA [Candidatus Omnitrophica bacterium]|nr:Flp pilus assembly complex ATPase component TadA [Candidatus Omnitrophota bacterium]